MAASLVPCPSCARHIRVSESTCPFCASAIVDDLGARVIPGTSQRLGRSAYFAFAATLTVAGCGGTTADPTPTGGVDSGTSSDAGHVNDSGGAVPAYGLPAQPVDAGVPDNDAGVAPPYGFPPPPEPDAGDDAGDGKDDGGRVFPVYGAPPPGSHL